ncbi:hypothetical protein ACRS5A_18375 [Acinetobacter baumannii]|uniref:hypothetical protein n=1 Tax=Acinetobacter baumannii TaxID=470 RepID=UPI003B2D94AD
MTVKTTGFTIQDAFEAKTKRLRNKFANFVTPAREASEAIEACEALEAAEAMDNLESMQKLSEAIRECASNVSSPSEELLRLQQRYPTTDWAAAIYAEILKDLASVNGQVTTVPRTRLGAQALRDHDIDLDTVNYAFDRAMKHSHG